MSRVMCWPAVVKSHLRSAVPPGKLPVRRPVTRLTVGAECFGTGDLGRVGVFRGCAGLPGPDFSPWGAQTRSASRRSLWDAPC
jgi:hypothetical protein